MTKKNELIEVTVKCPVCDGKEAGSCDYCNLNGTTHVLINPNQPTILNWAKAEWNKKLELLQIILKDKYRSKDGDYIHHDCITEEINKLRETENEK